MPVPQTPNCEIKRRTSDSNNQIIRKLQLLYQENLGKLQLFWNAEVPVHAATQVMKIQG